MPYQYFISDLNVYEMLAVKQLQYPITEGKVGPFPTQAEKDVALAIIQSVAKDLEDLDEANV